MNHVLAALRNTLWQRNGHTNAVCGFGGEEEEHVHAETNHEGQGFRTTTPEDDEDLLWAEMLGGDAVPKEFFAELLAFGETGGCRGQGDATQASPCPPQAYQTLSPAVAAATQHAQWSQEEWGLDNHSLAVLDLRSNAVASSVPAHAMDGEAVAGSEMRDPEESGISQREAMKRGRLQRAFAKNEMNAALRKELLRNGASICDVVGCCEPKMGGSKMICSIHKASLELALESEAGPHRWCLYCHTCHPVSSFVGGSRTMCAVKYQLRKQRLSRLSFQSSRKSTLDEGPRNKCQSDDNAGKSAERGILSEASTVHKRRKIKRQEDEADKNNSSLASTTRTSGDSCESTLTAAVNDESGTRGDVVWIDGQIGYDKDVRFGSYQTSYRCEVLDLKVDMNPDVLAHQDSLLLDAVTSLQNDYYSRASYRGDDLFGCATLPARVGTPAVAAMSPGCTLLTISSMTLKAYGDESLRKRVTHLVASTGTTGILQCEQWGIVLTASGTDEVKADEVYCATADGGRVTAEHRGTPWPTEVRTPLCVVAKDIVTLDLSAVAQPSAVLWLGDGVNTTTSATVTEGSTPLVVSLRVPPNDCCSMLSVKMLAHGQCMGTGFQHILVLPNDDGESVVIAHEINKSCDAVAAAVICDEGGKEAVIGLRRMRLYRNVTTDLAWLLTAHESGAAYENPTVIARAIKIASGLQLVYSGKYGCPVLERRLEDIELDLLEYDEMKQGDAMSKKNGIAEIVWMAACFIPDGNHSLFISTGSHGGVGSSDGDNGEDELLREESFRGVLGTQRATPMTDIGVMLLWPMVANVYLFPKLCTWNARLLPGKLGHFLGALCPTGFLDGSILTRTVAGCAALVVTAYSCYLVRRDVRTWIKRRESLVMMGRITSMLFIGYLRRLTLDTNEPELNRATKFARFAVIQILHMVISMVIAPLRFERHALTEIIRFPIMVFDAVVHSSWSTYEVVAGSVVVFILDAWEVLYLWRSERDFRRRAKVDVISSYRGENLAPPWKQAFSRSTGKRHPKHD